MSNIYLNADMNVRISPSLDAQVLDVRSKGNILPVIDIIESEGNIWFLTPGGYIANTTSVFLHADKYGSDNEKLKEYITAFLDQSYKTTGKSIEEIKKGLDKF